MAETISGAALERLLEHRAKFLSFLQRRIESREVAEDILQNAFVRGLERGGELRDDESAVAWFYRMLRNAVIDHYRHRASTERAMKEWAAQLETETRPDEMIHDVSCACIGELIDELKPEYRDAIRSVDLEEKSLSELAEANGISANNAAVRVHRARTALRNQVKKVCGTCATHGCVDCRCKK